MLPNNFRLKKRTAFTATYKSGKSFSAEGITVFCGKEKTNDLPTKIGFVVSKKTHKRAVKRNRIKRLMRESVRLYIKSQNNDFPSKYMSLIFVASTRALGKNFKETDTTIQKLLGVINK